MPVDFPTYKIAEISLKKVLIFLILCYLYIDLGCNRVFILYSSVKNFLLIHS